jgi:hypothetical protein
MLTGRYIVVLLGMVLIAILGYSAMNLEYLVSEAENASTDVAVVKGVNANVVGMERVTDLQLRVQKAYKDLSNQSAMEDATVAANGLSNDNPLRRLAITEKGEFNLKGGDDSVIDIGEPLDPDDEYLWQLSGMNDERVVEIGKRLDPDDEVSILVSAMGSEEEKHVGPFLDPDREEAVIAAEGHVTEVITIGEPMDVDLSY